MLSNTLRWLAICATIIVSLAYLSRNSLKEWQCARNLKKIDIVLKACAQKDSAKSYPPLSLTPGLLMCGADALGADSAKVAYSLVSYVHPDRDKLTERAARSPQSLIDDRSYWYLGYAFVNEGSALAWIDAYTKLAPAGQVVPDCFPMENAETGELLQQRLTDRWPRRRDEKGHYRLFKEAVYARLRVGVDASIAHCFDSSSADAVSAKNIPVALERPELHGKGGHVLYLDGHVAFVPYPGPFPMTKDFIEGLRSLEELKSRAPSKVALNAPVGS